MTARLRLSSCGLGTGKTQLSFVQKRRWLI